MTPAIPRLFKRFSPVHAAYLYAGRTLDVFQAKDSSEWECLEVCSQGLVGVELAKGATAAQALANGIRAVSRS